MTAAPPRRRPAPVVPAAPRLAARAQAERSQRRGLRVRRAWQGLLVLLAVGAVAWVLLGSTWLAVDRVVVSGVSRLSADEVRAVAPVPAGTPLARVDTGAIAERVRALAPVAEVAVQRSWPGTLEVVVTERTAVAGVLQDGVFTLLDAGGRAFATERALPRGAVRLQVPEPGPEDAATRAALAVHREVPSPLRERVRIVRAASPSSVALLLDSGKQVVWGAPGGDAATKAAAAQALLKMPGDVFDVSAPGVVVRR